MTSVYDSYIFLTKIPAKLMLSHLAGILFSNFRLIPIRQSISREAQAAFDNFITLASDLTGQDLLG